MKNNIKELLEIKKISINELSKQIEKDYSTTHALVNRDSLNSTTLDTLLKVADVLNVNLDMLYSDKKDEIEILKNIENGYIGGVAYHTRNMLEKDLEKTLNENGIDCKVKIEYSLELKELVEDKLIINLTNFCNNDETVVFLKFETDSHSFIFKNRFIRKVSDILNNIETISEENILQAFNLKENERIYHCTNLIDVKI